MKKIGFTLLLLFCGIWVSKAQNVIAVENNSTPAFFTNLDSAIVHAQNGDTVYLPAGSIQGNSFIINKRVHIIGVGYNLDSCTAMGTSNIIGHTLQIIDGADGCSIQGVNFNAGPSIQIGNIDGSSVISNITISRNNLVAIKIYGANISNVAILENYIGYYSEVGGTCDACYTSINFGNSSNHLIEKNIFQGRGMIKYGTNMDFENNVINIPYYASLFQGITYCTFKNNIFYRGNTLSGSLGSTYCNFYNNLYELNYVSITGTGNSYFNNIITTLNSIFVSPGTNFHLVSNSPGKNAGTDGTDVGIFGSYDQWKEGDLPVNPHIQYQNISNTTNTNGNLNVNIKVAAQDH